MYATVVAETRKQFSFLSQKIAAILSQELVQGNSIIMITETLDTTFDAFGEDGLCDKVLASSGLAKKLCQFPAILKAKVRLCLRCF